MWRRDHGAAAAEVEGTLDQHHLGVPRKPRVRRRQGADGRARVGAGASARGVAEHGASDAGGGDEVWGVAREGRLALQAALALDIPLSLLRRRDPARPARHMRQLHVVHHSHARAEREDRQRPAARSPTASLLG